VYGSFNNLRRNGTRDWLGALALLGLLLRALVPAGFMPSPVHGEMRLVLCAVPGTDIARHEHLPRTGSDNLPCPFATGGAGAIPSAEPADLRPVVLSLLCATTLYRAPPGAAPLRHAAPRGPPVPA
jgi:hypothetical protein